MTAGLSGDQAETFARVALANVAREYPYHLVHLARHAADIARPREQHPLFWGSYDWHSCVHMHWSLARCLRLFPWSAGAANITRHFDQRFNPAAAAVELDYLQSPERTSFERPYGWSWLLKLQAELELLARSDDRAVAWRDAIAPLASAIASRSVDFLPRADFAVRAGAHGNSAFALLLSYDYAQTVQHRALLAAIADRANRWFGRDRRYPADYEPSGDDFLSGGLCEAALMVRTIDGCSFADWWDAFAPSSPALANWLAPVRVSDGTDPKIVHLYGLNLSRAWCWRLLRNHLPRQLHAPVDAAIDAYLHASLGAAVRGDYVGTHWLVSFALLALTDPETAA